VSEFLAIKNWDKRQPGRNGKSEWIKDYADKDWHPDYEKLSFFQRQVLDGCRRLRARLGENIPNDPNYIARSLHAIRTDRPHVHHAISALIEQGLLIPTGESLDSLDKEKEIDKEEKKKEPKAVSPAAVAKFALPGWVEKQAWDDYEQMRRRIGKPMTDRARELAVDKLAALQNKGHPVADVLRQSVFNSWQGLFELKQQAMNGKRSKLQENLDALAEL